MADPELTKQFEAQGRDSVLARLGSFQGNVFAEAIAWLAVKEREEREQAAEAQAVALSTKRAAWIAAIVGIATLAVAIAAIFR